MEGLLPISSPRSRHSRWCRDRGSVECACAHGEAVARVAARNSESAHNNASACPRHGYCVCNRFSLAPGRDINFYVATWLRHGLGCLGLSRDLIFMWRQRQPLRCRDMAFGVTTRKLRVSCGLSRHSFWCRDMGQAFWCLDTIFGVATWFSRLA